MTSQADAFGQIAGGPAIGAVGSLVSIRTALAAAGLVLTPGLALYFRALKQPVAVAISEEAPTASSLEA
jgi:hypothetical protein